MKKLFPINLMVILILAITLSGCGGGGGSGGGGTTPPPNVSFDILCVPSAASFPTGKSDSGTGSVSSAYWMAKTEVTYELWSAVYTWATNAGARGANVYHFQNLGVQGDGTGDTNQHPVTTINWRDAMVWCNALTEYYNAQNGTNFACVYTYTGTIVRDSRNANAEACDNVTADVAAKGFRLPTSMEWELAARYQNGINWTPGNHVSGDTTSYCYPSDGGTSMVFGDYAWYTVNSSSSTHAVGTAGTTGHPNALGICDMSGNVFEWCFDKYGPGRVLRGGSWPNIAEYLQLGDFFTDFPIGAYNNLGFRPVRSL